jgi:glycosyltransferase involved in cell wall biosynthesis
MKPLVSVLMPVYNAAATLADCLESIRSQTFSDFEVVAVDDGSTDESAHLLEAQAREGTRFRVIRAPHKGIVAALNAGLAQCRGAFVARMDSDDLMRPDRLGKQVAFMEEEPACDLAGTFVAPYGIGKTLSRAAIAYHDWLNSSSSDTEIKEAMFVDSPIAHSTFFARRELYVRLAGYRDCEWAEDYDFLFRAQGGGATFGKVREVLLDRGDRDGRLTRVDRRYKRKTMFQAKAHYFARGAWLDGKRGVMVAGTGPSGRVVAGALRANNVAVSGFMDNRVGPPGRTVMGIPADGFPGCVPEDFLSTRRDCFFAVCVGEPESRDAIIARLCAVGMRPTRDFARFI